MDITEGTMVGTTVIITTIIMVITVGVIEATAGAVVDLALASLALASTLAEDTVVIMAKSLTRNILRCLRNIIQSIKIAVIFTCQTLQICP